MVMDCIIFFFFNDTATTEIYTLSLHDALPILVYTLPAHLRFMAKRELMKVPFIGWWLRHDKHLAVDRDRKSTRLNSSHANISYAVFCLKKKKKITSPT